MALQNSKIFGLNVLSYLTDVQSKTAALQNLGINPFDLEVIRGSADAGMSRYDWVSFSRLSVPLVKTLDRYQNEASTYNSILLKRAGTDQTLFGNLDINGSLSGGAIRYRYLEDGTNQIKIADISTSRISAWSSAANPVLPTSPISYGAQVGINTGGKLQFGTQSGTTGPRLQTTIVPEEKEFISEVPTSAIECNINGEVVKLYAMKGIPLIFKGFFRNLNATINVNYSGIPASWKIVETANENRYVNFQNQGTSESKISFRSARSRERFIKFYYNPALITKINITSANIASLPNVSLSSCNELNFAYNQLKTFPNFAFVAPNLQTLSIMRNPFYLSDIEAERTLNNTASANAIFNKIKTSTNSLRTLNMEGTFYGTIVRHIIPEKLPNLVSFNCGRGGGAYFHPDSASSDSFCPDIPLTVTSYNIGNNDFRSVTNTSITGNSDYPNNSYTFKSAPNLTYLNVGGNSSLSDTDSNYTLASGSKLIEINYSSTNLAIPSGLDGSNTLTKYSHSYGRTLTGTRGLFKAGNVYAFNGCVNLGTIGLYAAQLDGSRFPRFTNVNLTDLDLRYTNITGGRPDGDETKVIHSTTFDQCAKLTNLYIDSGSLLNGKEIATDAFTQNPSLYYLWYRSYGRTGGTFPDLSTNENLTYIWMQQNAFTGSIPSFLTNRNLHYINLTQNNFDGSIPTFKNLNNLRYIFIQNNQLTTISEPESGLTNLWYYYAHNNNISGQIPDFSNCTALRYLTLYNNSFTAYKSGAFAKLYRIRYIDLSNNNLTQQALDKIIDDLFINWNAIKRGGVTVNLRGNGSPSTEQKTLASLLVGKGWSITIDGGLEV
tara:strand:+ start:7166 stop:9661 length:2496 start_codon:yes stop_codon:yes gene_type:complete